MATTMATTVPTSSGAAAAPSKEYNNNNAAAAGAPRPPTSPPPPTTKPRKRKRQLKMEDFKLDVALPHVYNNFYDNFSRASSSRSPSAPPTLGRTTPSGDRDHPSSRKRESTARGLTRLIELYYRWQHWAFPGFGFRDFAEKAQTFGGSYLFKRELDELRKEAINICSRQGLEPAAEDEDAGIGGGDADENVAAAMARARRAKMDWVEEDLEDLREDDFDDEDFLALQKEAPQPGSPQGQEALGVGGPDDLGDRELNDLLADDPADPAGDEATAGAGERAAEAAEGGGPIGEAGAKGALEEEDEELQDLLAD